MSTQGKMDKKVQACNQFLMRKSPFKKLIGGAPGVNKQRTPEMLYTWRYIPGKTFSAGRKVCTPLSVTAPTRWTVPPLLSNTLQTPESTVNGSFGLVARAKSAQRVPSDVGKVSVLYAAKWVRVGRYVVAKLDPRPRIEKSRAPRISLILSCLIASP